MVLNALREKGWSAKLHVEATIKSCPHKVDISVLASTNHKAMSFCAFIRQITERPYLR
jgi:hypothetical protein